RRPVMQAGLVVPAGLCRWASACWRVCAGGLVRAGGFVPVGFGVLTGFVGPAWTCGPAGVGLSSGMATLGAPIGLDHRHRASGRARAVAGVTVSAVSLVLMVAQVPFFVSIAL